MEGGREDRRGKERERKEGKKMKEKGDLQRSSIYRFTPQQPDTGQAKAKSPQFHSYLPIGVQRHRHVSQCLCSQDVRQQDARLKAESSQDFSQDHLLLVLFQLYTFSMSFVVVKQSLANKRFGFQIQRAEFSSSSCLIMLAVLLAINLLT